MSYNTRRTNVGGYGGPQHTSAANVGQRRPTGNFVSGGQSPAQQQPQQYSTPAQKQQQQQQQQRSVQQQQQSQQQQVRNTPVKTEVKPVVQVAKPTQSSQSTQPATAPLVPGANPPPPEAVEPMEGVNEETEKKKIWLKGKGNKISKAEKVRRRNLKLSKILQPKNAVMILNELVRGCVYNVEEMPVKVDVNQFRGTVSFDGQEFAGTGRTKIAARNAAAETALKHLVKNKQLTCGVKKEDEDGDEKMEITEEEGSQVMPWSHIASFAMYKLFSTWGEDPNIVNRVGGQETLPSSTKTGEASAPQELRPAKKLPENPETMNPLMLMHQMLPNAVWEEFGKSGVTPNVVFTFTVTIGDKKFTGTGSSKKIAKKLAAFAVCHELLKINYSPDVWTPQY